MSRLPLNSKDITRRPHEQAESGVPQTMNVETITLSTELLEIEGGSFLNGPYRDVIPSGARKKPVCRCGANLQPALHISGRERRQRYEPNMISPFKSPKPQPNDVAHLFLHVQDTKTGTFPYT